MERMFRSFEKNGKERKERSVLLKRTEKNGKNVPFFWKEQKRTERTFRSLEKNGKERKERNILLKRTDAQPCVHTSFVTSLDSWLCVRIGAKQHGEIPTNLLSKSVKIDKDLVDLAVYRCEWADLSNLAVLALLADLADWNTYFVNGHDIWWIST